MELQEFITNTLVAISDGVKNARVQNGLIAPPSYYAGGTDKGKGLVDDDGNLVSLVEFDIAVTASDTSGTNMKTGIAVVSFISGTASTKLDTAKENSTISRIKFSVPMSHRYPV